MKTHVERELKLRKYQIKSKVDGKSWELYHVKLHCTSWKAATKEFTEWLLDWMDDVSQDKIAEDREEIFKDYLRGIYWDTYKDDCTTYTITKVEVL